MKHIYILPLAIILCLFNATNVLSQCPGCSTVETHYVDLSSDPDSVWVSPLTGRSGRCCQGAHNQDCIRFMVKTSPSTGQLSFTLYTPPIPPGQTYSLDCGTEVSVGDPICVNGGGEFCIVYCKGGGDILQYQISSIRKAEASPPIIVGEACSDTLWVEGLTSSTINWDVVYPSSAYNSYLSCTSGCEQTIVTAQPGYPPFIDVEVTGTVINPCAVTSFIDTVRVEFVSDKTAEILPPEPNICFGGVGVELTAVGGGGYPPYSYLWSTGETTEKITANTEGSYAVTITDATDCPPIAATTVVTAHKSAITVDAGTAEVCVTDPSVQLSGDVQVATGGIWSGGGGTYNPDNVTLNAIYTMSQDEIDAKAASLTLTTTGNGGCVPETDVVDFTVVSAPQVYAGTDAQVCKNIDFYQLNGNVGGSAFQGKWETLGTGTFEDETNVITKYYPSNADTAAGSVSLVLATVKNTLCKVETDTIVLTFMEDPAVDFSFPQPVCTGENVAFTDLTTVSWGAADTYFWDFGNTVSSTQHEPTIAYTAPGTYDVSFTVTSDMGCSGSSTKQLIVSTDPVADFTFVNDCFNEAMSFADQSTNAISWQWDFSDGDATSGVENPSGIVFNAVGNHDVTLIVENSAGCTHSTTKQIEVFPLPVASFDVSQPACIGEVVSFTDQSVVASGIVSDFSWDFGNTATSILQNPVTTYPTSGTFVASLEVRTDNGCIDNITKSVVVTPDPVVDFTFTNSCFSDQTNFTDLTDDAVSWTWDFSDGDETSNDQNPANIVFNAVGTHNVSLEVVSSNGCIASNTKTIEIYPLPVVDFIFTQPACVGQTVNFTDQSVVGSGIITDYAWDFGNTQTSILKDASTVYASQGTYNASLTAVTNRGCTATESKTVSVSPDPVADFTFTDGCFNDGIDFTDASTLATSWSWNFSDGDITTSTQNPSGIVLNAVGSHDVTLSVVSASGCTHSTTKQVEVFPLPSTEFSFTQPACAGQTINFTDLSNIASGTNDSYSWDFGNSITSSLQNPTSSYATSGSYTVDLTVTSDKNCSNSASKLLVVSPDPIADFSSTQACFGDGMDFTDLSTGAVSWTWDFSGDAASTVQNPNGIVFNAIGTHSVSLTVESINGCANTKTANIVVDPLPTADFSFGQPACSGESINFTDLSAVATGTIDIYTWDFDNSSTSAQQNPSSSYDTDGSYVVSLGVTTDKGCSAATSKIVVVSPDPVADFSFSNACQSQAISFADGSTDAVSWTWDFDGSASSTMQNPSGITFGSTGSKNITLTVESAEGCVDTKTTSMDVHPVPVVNFNYTKPTCTGQSIDFEDLTTIASGSINSYQWDLGNSSTSSLQDPSTTYSTAGTYTVSLTATSNQGCTVSTTQDVVVTDGPSVDFSFANSCFNDAVDFTDLSTNAVVWNWDFSDGDASSTSQNPTGITFNAVGTHNITLTAEAAEGCVSSKTKTIDIYPHPVASFTSTQPACTDEVVSFTDATTISAGAINNYSWDFGDGTTSIQKSPNKTYSIIGTYAVSMIATSDQGCTSTVSKNIAVSPDPVADFTFSDACFGDGVDFTDASTGAVKWDWDFSSGASTSTDENPAGVTFGSVGTHTVLLSVESVDGCVSSKSRTIKIFAVPAPDFSFTQPACTDQNINFTNASTISTGTIDAYSWDFANTQTSLQQNPVTTYSSAGTYSVLMTATSDNGCAASITRNVIVSEAPVADFSFANGCFSDGIDFTDQSTGAVTWDWNFDNEASSSNENPAGIVFSSVGTHDVTLTVESTAGCSDTKTLTAEVYPLPNTFFSFTQPACTGDILNFTDLSTVATGSITGFDWDFANSLTSTLQHPTSSYATPGNYNVSLTATTDNGCSKTTTLALTVSEDPVANFSFDNGCFGDGMDFTDLSTDAVAWDWNFSNGDETSTNKNPSNIVFNAVGTHDVELTVTNGDGCTASETQTIEVHPNPVPDFSLTDPACKGQDVDFIDLSTVSSGVIDTYSWDFDNSLTATAQNPTTVYSTTGTFTVQMTATSDEGCSTSISKDVVVSQDPVANFSFANGCFGQGVDFADLSTDAAKWSWDFSSGDAVSSDQNPADILFNAVGVHDVSLTVESNKGCLHTKTQTIEIFPMPVVDFSFTQPACTGEDITFTDASTVSAGSISNYAWDFANSQTSTDEDPVTSYISPGTYTVNLQVTSSEGCTETASKDVEVSKDPVADFTFSDGCFSETVDFTDASTEAMKWTWDFSDGDGSSADQNPAGISFNAVGTHNVTLNVESSKGCTNSVTKTIEIFPMPEPDFSFTQPACTDQNINFTNLSTVSFGTIDGFSWDFANTQTSVQQNPVTVYASAGTYPVDFTVTSDKGCTATKTRNVIVSTEPTADFSFSDGCFKDAVDFTDLSTGAISWEWDFSGGDATSTNQNPSGIVFDAVGFHDVTLIVENANGCQNTLTKQIEIYPLPATFFDFTQPACAGQTINFTDLTSITTGSVNAYAWDFANSLTSTQQNPTSSYTVPGDYDVSLTTTSDKGCSESKTLTLTVSEDPVASFSFVNGCFNDGMDFSDLSTDAVKWNWDFSSGDETSTVQSPTNIIFNAVGDHDVTLTVENSNGCTDTQTQTIEVYPNPVTDFDFTQPACKGQVIDFTDQSSVSSGTVDSYSWDFDNTLTSVAQNPTSTYGTAGTYTVELTSTTDNGCSVTITKDLIVSEDPIADFNFSNGCFGDGIDFSDLSTDAVSWNWDFSNGDETSVEQNPSAIDFNTTGLHDVKLTVVSVNGCSNSKTKSIEIYATPVPDFTFTQPACTGQDVNFTNFSTISSGTINSYAWDFANTLTSTQINPVTQYASSGTYTVSLEIISDNGCDATLTKDVEVSKDPVADFSFSDGCFSESVDFTDASSGAVSWSWDFSDGDETSSDQNPAGIVFNAVGNHNVSLTVESSAGCTNTKTQVIEIFPMPVPDFSFTQPACIDQNINFTNLSTISSGTIDGFSWDFANTQTSVQPNPVTVYASSGTYAVNFVVTSDQGCSATRTRNVIVSSVPTADFTFTNGCFSDGMDFTDASTDAVKWTWDFSEGDETSANENPAGIVFNAVGLHDVALTVENTSGCQHSITKAIEVYPLPATFFDFTQPACAGQTISFTDLTVITTGSVSDYAWDFDNSLTSTQQNPASTYSVPGDYDVSLTATSDKGCVESKTLVLTVSEDPVASFSFVNGCFNDGMDFTDLSTDAVTWNWDFSSGDETSSVQSPTNIIFNAVGDHDVTLTVENSDGCVATQTQTIVVHPNPVPDFTFTQPACIGNTVNFTDQSSVSSGTVDVFAWDFANTLSSSAQNPTTTYSADGTFTVQLTVTSDNGCSTATTKDLIVSPDPVADFSYSNGCFGEGMSFGDLSVDAVSWDWDFSNGDETSTDQDPAGIVFNNIGLHDVQLTVTSADGCINTKTQSIEVYATPVPGFDFTQPACSGQDINFTNTSSINAGAINSYAWDFANSKTATTTNPITVYSSPGTYPVVMTATSDNGCTASITQDVEVSKDPVADFAFINACYNTGMNFTDLSLNASQWDWDFSNGDATSTDQNPSNILLNAEGTHNVTLTVTSAAGCVNTTSKNVTVYPLPVPNYNFSQPACSGENINFTSTSTVSSGAIVSYLWDFNNTLSSVQANPFTVYDVAGTYSVKLTTTTDRGCVAEISQDVVVSEDPVADFSFANGCFNDGVDFSDISTGAVSWDWDFSDGDATSTSQDPAGIVFNSVGSHNVTLTVQNADGCSNTTTKQIEVYPLPVPFFTNSLPACSNETISFTDGSTVSTGSVTGFEWDFDNTLTAAIQNPTTSYSTPGTYAVRLTTTTNHGCKQTISKDLVINPDPVADFTFTNQCFNEGVNFTDQSTDAASWDWDFGGVSTSTDASPAGVIFPALGDHFVTLEVVSSAGCKNSTTKTVSIFPVPVAEFEFTDPACKNQEVAFTNKSTVSSGTINAYDWDFANTQVSTAQNPVTTYSTAGTFAVDLTVTSNKGCVHSITKDVTISPDPTANFSFANKCFDETMSFTDLSVDAVSWDWDFSDGDETSSAQNPSGISFNVNGTHNVTLTVESANGCTNTKTQVVEAYPLPVTDFSFTQPACTGEEISFTNLSSIDYGTIDNYEWDFANTFTSLQQHPKTSYSLAGTFQVTMKATSDKGCSQTLIKDVEVSKDPVADFAFVNGCVNNTLSFNDLSTSVISWSWDFAGESASTQQNPSGILFDDVGVHDVSLTVETAEGCTNTKTKQIEIYPRPVPDFTFTQPACTDQNVVFDNVSSISSGSIVSFAWDFNNTITSTQFNPVTTYSTAATYAVKLTATSEKGCSETVTKDLVVSETPTAAFASDKQCFGQGTDFTDMSAGAASWDWNFSNDAVSTDQHPQDIVFDATGLHPVTLTVTSAEGCINTLSNIINIYPVPKADFNVDNVCVGDNVTFYDNSVVTDDIINSWLWDFNGVTSTQKNPVQSFSSSDVINVELIASTATCSDTVTRVLSPLKKPSFTPSPQEGCSPLNVYFDNDVEPNVVYKWDFDDGVTAATAEPDHIFLNQTGATKVFNVKLHATSIYGCQDSTTVPITVYHETEADFAIDDNKVCSETVVNFTNNSQYGVTYNWKMGDGSVEHTTEDVAYAYSNSTVGNDFRQVTLISTTADNCSDTVKKFVTVYPIVENDITLSATEACHPADITLTANTEEVSYAWDYGDGDAENGSENMNHTFNNITTSDITYTVTLTTTSQHNCSSQTTADITVHPSPIAQFTVPETVVCSPYDLDITNGTSGAVSYDWTYGDGDVSTETALAHTHTYNNSGTDQVENVLSLVATSIDGCTDTYSQSIFVSPDIVADFAMDTDKGCDPLTVNFSNTTSGGNTYKWTFDASNSVTQVDPQFTFENTESIDKVYDIVLDATSKFGCKSSITYPVTVYPSTDADFAIDDNQICSDNVVSFTNNSRNADINTWGFGDGSATSSDTDPSHNYINATDATVLHTVTLSTETNNGCTSSVQKTVTVFPIPSSDITLDANEGCHPVKITMSAESGADTYEWIYGDGGSETAAQSINHTYSNTSGADVVYTVDLTVTSADGCQSNSTADITVHPTPIPQFSISEDMICAPADLTLTNNSTGATSYEWDYGDGATGTDANAEHTHLYENKDAVQNAHTITLVAINADGCRNQTSLDVNVSPEIHASFTSDVDAGCDPLDVNFANTSTGATTYAWEFDASNKTTESNPDFTFTNADPTDKVYIVKMKAASIYGCIDEFDMPITVYPSTDADFTIDDNQICSDNMVSFTNNSRNADISKWDFGDGSAINNDVDPTHVFVNSTSATILSTVTLTTETNKGCTSLLQKAVTVYPIPASDITLDVDAACHPATIQLSATTGAKTYTWDYGDGESEVAPENTTHIFSNPSDTDEIFTVSLTATSANGCESQSTTDVTVYPTPVADFSIDDSQVCGESIVSFTNETINATAHSWDFGDGTAKSTDVNPSHQYFNTTRNLLTNKITLFSSTDKGCTDSISKSVSIFPLPESDITLGASTGCHPFNIEISAPAGSKNYAWDFGDGGADSGSDNVNHTFNNTSDKNVTYTVEVTATSTDGCISSSTTDVTVFPTPEPAFSLSEKALCAPDELSITNATIKATSYEWDYGDGTTGADAAVVHNHLYENNEPIQINRKIILTATSDDGCTDSTSQIVALYPAVVAGYQTDVVEGCTPLELTFENLSSGAESYNWDFGDGSISSQTTPDHVFKNETLKDEEQHVVKLKATSKYGCADSIDLVYTVFPATAADFVVDNTKACSGTSLNFTNQSINASSYNWTFGDGNSSTDTDPSHAYENIGDATVFNTVTLTSFTDKGCVDSVQKFMTIFGIPENEIILTPPAACHPADIELVASSSTQTYLWDYGDGQAEIAPQTVKHTFENNTDEDAVFTITLTGTTLNGCISETTAELTVYPSPVIDFSIAEDAACAPHDLSIRNNTTGAVSYEWDYDDGSTGTDANAVHTHLFENNTNAQFAREISLVATSDKGCTSTAKTVFTLSPFIEAQFVADVEIGCPPLEVNVTNQSTGADDYKWSFGDEGTSTNFDASHVYSNNSSTNVVYDLKLGVESKFGCTDSMIVPITVYPATIAEFETTPTQICSGETVTYANSSINAIAYTWDFGDESEFSSEKEPSHQYINQSEETVFRPVQLITESPDGCLDSSQQFVTVYPIPVNPIVLDKEEGCHPLDVNMTVALGSKSYTWDYGDGKTELGSETMDHTFKNETGDDAVYTVTLTTVSKENCESSTTTEVTVRPSPTAEFELESVEGCAPYSLAITDLSKNATAYSWDYGDGFESDISEEKHIHVFENETSTITSRVIELSVTNEFGCTKTHDETINVFPEIHASFTNTEPQGCTPVKVEFENTSTGATSYKWDFGDGNISTSHVATSNDYINKTQEVLTYNTMLIATSAYNCVDTSEVLAVSINPIPAIEFTPKKTAGCSPIDAQFNNSTVGAVSYFWDFGDGVTSEEQSPQHTFVNLLSETVINTITHVATNELGCSDTVVETISVYPEVRAVFGVGPEEGCSPLELDIENNSLNSALFKWDFGDGSFASTSSPEKTFVNNTTEDQTRTVKLVVSSQENCKDSSEIVVSVYAKPTADFILEKAYMEFPEATARVSNNTKGEWNYKWDFGDGRISEEKEPVSHKYDKPGQYIISLEAYDECSDMTSLQVVIGGGEIIADYDSIPSGCAPLTVQFNNKSVNATSYLWGFNDGSTSTEENPVHTFEEPGSYPITLTAFNEESQKTVSNYIVTVYPVPHVEFEVAPSVTFMPEATVSFYNLSEFGANYIWYFGNGDSSLVHQPTYKYTEAGTYTIKFVVESEQGCIDSIVQPSAVDVRQNCIMKFPNAFTPADIESGGEYDPELPEVTNDIFHPIYENIEGYSLQIFNRWGELIFESDDINVGWDGFYKGELSKQDVYIWQAKGECWGGKTIKKSGNVTLIR